MQNAEKILCSIVVLTKNSEKTIRHCLESAKRFDEVIILDGNSTDGTLKIAKEFLNVKVFFQKDSKEKNISITDFGATHQKALGLASNYWILKLDSDEYLDEILAEEISRIVGENNVNTIGWIKQCPIIEGKKTHGVFFYPYYLRLFNKKSDTHYDVTKNVHEKLIFDKNIVSQKFLNGVFFHFWPLYKEMIKKHDAYLSITLQGKEKLSFKRVIRNIIINLLKAVNMVKKILAMYFRYGFKNSIPIKYSVLYVRYHFLIAWYLIKRKFVKI